MIKCNMYQRGSIHYIMALIDECHFSAQINARCSYLDSIISGIGLIRLYLSTCQEAWQHGIIGITRCQTQSVISNWLTDSDEHKSNSAMGIIAWIPCHNPKSHMETDNTCTRESSSKLPQRQNGKYIVDIRKDGMSLAGSSQENIHHHSQ